MKPRHIIVITTSFPITQDGSESAGSFVLDFVHTLHRHTSVAVVAPGVANTHWMATDQIQVDTYHAPKQPLSLLKPYLPKDLIAIVLTLRNASRALSNAIARRKPDHIFALWVLPSGYWAMRAAKHQGISFSTWALGSDIWNLGKIPVVRSILRKVLRTSQVNFADGVQLQADVQKLADTECRFLPSTRRFDHKVSKTPNNHPPYRLAFLGRWHPNKGVDLLCDALLALGESAWQRIEAVRICGGGPMAPMITKKIRLMQSGGRQVSMGGFLAKTEALELLGWADFVLIPSRIESIPVIFSDAMKANCPVICMPVGDLPRLVERYGVGVLSETVDARAFAEAISRATQISPLDFEKSLKRASQDFDLKRIVPDFLRSIDQT